MKRSRVWEWFWLTMGTFAIMAAMFGLIFAIVSLDKSPDHCAIKIQSKVYDPKCF
jgi:hypothetical protein